MSEISEERFTRLEVEVSDIKSIVKNGMQSDIRLIKKILGWGGALGFSSMFAFMIWLIQEVVKGRV